MKDFDYKPDPENDTDTTGKLGETKISSLEESTRPIPSPRPHPPQGKPPDPDDK